MATNFTVDDDNVQFPDPGMQILYTPANAWTKRDCPTKSANCLHNTVHFANVSDGDPPAIITMFFKGTNASIFNFSFDTDFTSLVIDLDGQQVSESTALSGNLPSPNDQGSLGNTWTGDKLLSPDVQHNLSLQLTEGVYYFDYAAYGNGFGTETSTTSISRPTISPTSFPGTQSPHSSPSGDSNGGSSSKSMGLIAPIAGASVGVVVLLTLVLGILLCRCRSRRKRMEHRSSILSSHKDGEDYTLPISSVQVEPYVLPGLQSAYQISRAVSGSLTIPYSFSTIGGPTSASSQTPRDAPTEAFYTARPSTSSSSRVGHAPTVPLSEKALMRQELEKRIWELRRGAHNLLPESSSRSEIMRQPSVSASTVSGRSGYPTSETGLISPQPQRDSNRDVELALLHQEIDRMRAEQQQLVQLVREGSAPPPTYCPS